MEFDQLLECDSAGFEAYSLARFPTFAEAVQKACLELSLEFVIAITSAGERERDEHKMS